MSPTVSFPVFPPNTNKYGLEYTNECPYLLPGVVPTTGTIIHYASSSPFLKSKKYKSSGATPPPPVAPPYTTIYNYSTATLA